LDDNKRRGFLSDMYTQHSTHYTQHTHTYTWIDKIVGKAPPKKADNELYNKIEEEEVSPN